MMVSAEQVLALLPQTQCTRCGYPNCATYAQAIAEDKAEINQCPPGGAQGIEKLALLTGRATVALNQANGVEGPRAVAFIDENWCIGCTLCLKACPTDAIMGSSKLMHTVLEAYCTGCELCLPVCPVDCIKLENASGTATGWGAWSAKLARQAHSRYEFSNRRRIRDEAENARRLEEKAQHKQTDLSSHSLHTDPAVLDEKRIAIETALKRARAKCPSGESESLTQERHLPDHETRRG